MVRSPSLYGQSFSSWAEILCKHGVRSTQKWSYLNFHVLFEFGDLETTPSLLPLAAVLAESGKFDKMAGKNNMTIGTFTLSTDVGNIAYYRVPQKSCGG